MHVFGVTDPGSFSEYAVVPKSCIVRLDDALSYEQGAMLEAMGAGVHGVEKAQVKGKTVLVSGCGPIGPDGHRRVQGSRGETDHRL